MLISDRALDFLLTRTCTYCLAKCTLRVYATLGNEVDGRIHVYASVTCHMGRYCQPMQVNASCFNASQADPVLGLPTPEGWQAELTLAVDYILRCR